MTVISPQQSSPQAPDGVIRDRPLQILLETKTSPPPVRDQDVPRERLSDRLRIGECLRLTLVACPAGFGKTTLLARWREVEAVRRPVAWLTLDSDDNDPGVLWSYVIEALRQVCPTVGERLPSHSVGAESILAEVLPQLMNELNDLGEVTLILDDFHLLRDGPARDSIAWLVDHAPPGFQLVLSTRTEPTFPLASLRAHGQLVELRANDLRFTSDEADAFLNKRLALDLSPDDVNLLNERMDGWPAGLYLAALSLEGIDDRHDLLQDLGASSRHVVDFLQEEVLEAHDAATQSLMLHTSVLKSLSGPVCDAVEERQHTAEMLEQLSRSNLFLLPLPGASGSYRFHPLFATLLRVELERREPGAAALMHRRAYAWHRDNGHTGEAISHAIQGGAYAEARELVEGSWIKYANTGHHETVLDWIRQFPTEIREADVRLLIIEAWVLSLSARRAEANLTIGMVETIAEVEVSEFPPEGFSSVQASLTLLRACCPWGDVATQLENGRRATELEGPSSPARPVACWALGTALYFRGDVVEADQWLAEAGALAFTTGQWLAGAWSLAYRSLIAGERGDLGEQRILAEQAAKIVGDHGIEAASGPVLVALGVSLVKGDRPNEALALIERGIGLLPRFRADPIELAIALLHQASVLRILGESERSRRAVADARVIVESCPDPGIVAERLREFDRFRRAYVSSGDQNLSRQEVRVLHLLTGDHTEREIARQLYLSYNTVHSHVRSIYRKLGVSARAEAVARARELR